MRLLECRGITKTYGRISALSEIDFVLEPGSVTAVLGLNGAGKSTLFRILAGLIVSFSGELYFRERKLRRGPGDSHDTMFLFDDPRLFEEFDERGNSRLIADLNGGWERSQAPRRAGTSAAMEATGSDEAGRKRIGEYSHGMRCRLAFELFAAHSRPALMVLDEPTNGLDIEALERLEHDLAKRAREDGTAVLFSTHYLEMVERTADRALILRNGRLVAEATGKDLEASRLRSLLLGEAGKT